MPWAPLKLCAEPGCRERVSSRHCVRHARIAAREREARRSPRIVDGETQSGGGNRVDWRALRKACLARDPICKICKVKKSTHADHIVPKRAGGRDVLSNLQGTCHSCNSRKCASAEGGFGNRRATNRATGEGVRNPPEVSLESARPHLQTHPQVFAKRFGVNS